MRRVEDGEALQERDGLWVVAGLAGTFLFFVWHETVSIDDGRTTFAFPNVAAKRQRLAESQPALAGKAVFDDGTPEDQNVDAGIAATGRGVVWHG